MRNIHHRSAQAKAVVIAAKLPAPDAQQHQWQTAIAIVAASLAAWVVLMAM